MPIPTTCPECQAVYDLADHLGGKRVLCAGCRCAIEVPSPDAVQGQPSPAPAPRPERKMETDRPRRRRRLDWDDDEDRLRRRPKPKTSSALVVGLVVGGVLVFGCGLCGLVGLLRSSSGPQPRPPMALAPPPINPPFVQPPDAGLPEVRQGEALAKQGRAKEAEEAFREAVRRNPDSAWAHCKLGLHLQEQGRFAEALVELRRGHDLGMRVPGGWNQPSAAWVGYCEHLIDMDRRFPAILAGDAEPADDAEGVEYVTFSVVYKHRPATAARLAAATLAGDPRLAPEQYDLCLYNGACGAALAAAGRGDDAKGLPDKVVVMLRRQALRWLREDLKRYEQEAPLGGVVLMNVRRMLAHWQVDDDLSTVRDGAALDRLPEDERRAWQGLWKDVAALRQKVGAGR